MHSFCRRGSLDFNVSWPWPIDFTKIIYTVSSDGFSHADRLTLSHMSCPHTHTRINPATAHMQRAIECDFTKHILFGIVNILEVKQIDGFAFILYFCRTVDGQSVHLNRIHCDKSTRPKICSRNTRNIASVFGIYLYAWPKTKSHFVQ